MAQVAVTINGRRYDLSCDDGQETHVRGLADDIDVRVRELTAAVGPVGEARLLLLAALLLADELSEARQNGGSPPTSRPEPPFAEGPPLSEAMPPPGETATLPLAGGGATPFIADAQAVAVLQSLATRIEAVVARLKAT